MNRSCFEKAIFITDSSFEAVFLIKVEEVEVFHIRV